MNKKEVQIEGHEVKIPEEMENERVTDVEKGTLEELGCRVVKKDELKNLGDKLKFEQTQHDFGGVI